MLEKSILHITVLSMCSRLLLLVVPLLLVAACGRKNPVSEVSVAETGVIIADSRGSLSPDDWNGWRGPQNNGIVPLVGDRDVGGDEDEGLVTEWSEQTNIRWRSDIPGRGHGSPIIVGDSVYLATALEDRQQQCVVAYDFSNGEQKWQTVLHQGGFPSQRELHSKSTHANATLASDGERLFAAMLNSDAIIATALDFDGEIVWQEEIGKFVSKFGYAPSPILYRSLVIFAADNSGGGYLAAVDGASGQIAWRVSRGNQSSYSSPVVATVGGRDQLLISGCGAVASYDPTTGEELWRTPCTAESTCGTIVTTDELIFAAGGYPEKQTVCLSAKGQLIWSNRTKVYEPSMLVLGENLFAINDDGIAFCWSARSGDLHWKKRLGGNFSASPIAYGERIYVSNLDGDTFVLKAANQFSQIAKNRLGNDCYASPAVSGSDLFKRLGVGVGEGRKEQLVRIGLETDE